MGREDRASSRRRRSADPISTPRENAQPPREESRGLRDSARETTEQSRRLRAEAARIGRLFALLLADLNESATRPASGAEHSERLEELCLAATDFGRGARAREESPEAMLIRLKEALAEVAPALRAFDRDQLSHLVTRMAIEGYYDL